MNAPVLPWLLVPAFAASPANTVSAEGEIERRAALLALEGDLVGESALLALFRAALDAYVEAATRAPPGALRRTWSLTRGWRLATWDMAYRTGKPLVRVPDQLGYDVPNGALNLHHETRTRPDDALRVLRLIERATEALRAR